MLGNVQVLPDASDIDTFVYERSPFTGRRLGPIVRSAWKGSMTAPRLMVLATKHRFYSQGGRREDLPHIVGMIGGLEPQRGRVGSAQAAIERSAAKAAAFHQAIAELHHATTKAHENKVHARLRHAKMQETMAGIGENWFQRKARETREALEREAQRVRHAAEAAEAATRLAAEHAAAAARAAADKAAEEARRAGRSIEQAAEDAARAAKKHADEALDDMRRARDKILPTGYKRVVYDITVVPQPVGFADAITYIKHHRDEVVDSLPPTARNFIRNAEKHLHDIFSGKAETIGDYAANRLQWMGNVGSPTWIKRIAEAWDHLSNTTKALILTVTLVLLIIGIILLIFAAPALVPWGHGSAMTYAAAFHAFYVAVGGPAVGAMISGLLGFYRAKAAGKPDMPANLPPIPAPPADVPPGDRDAMGAALAEAERDRAKQELPKKIAVGAGAAGLLALLAL